MNEPTRALAPLLPKSFDYGLGAETHADTTRKKGAGRYLRPDSKKKEEDKQQTERPSVQRERREKGNSAKAKTQSKSKTHTNTSG